MSGLLGLLKAVQSLKSKRSCTIDDIEPPKSLPGLELDGVVLWALLWVALQVDEGL